MGNSNDSTRKNRLKVTLLIRWNYHGSTKRIKWLYQNRCFSEMYEDYT